jgi:hypothetical protein
VNSIVEIPIEYVVCRYFLDNSDLPYLKEKLIMEDIRAFCLSCDQTCYVGVNYNYVESKCPLPEVISCLRQLTYSNYLHVRDLYKDNYFNDKEVIFLINAFDDLKERSKRFEKENKKLSKLVDFHIDRVPNYDI